MGSMLSLSFLQLSHYHDRRLCRSRTCYMYCQYAFNEKIYWQMESRQTKSLIYSNIDIQTSRCTWNWLEPYDCLLWEWSFSFSLAKLIMSSLPWKGCNEKRKSELFSVGMNVLCEGLRFNEMKRYSDEVRPSTITVIISYFSLYCYPIFTSVSSILCIVYLCAY